MKYNESDILKKAIEKAIKNGWNKKFSFIDDFVPIELTDEPDKGYARPAKDIIFSHDFAKAFWGEELINTEIIEDDSKYK